MKKLQARYLALAHAIQSSIAACISVGWVGASPKHLRTGLDTSKSDLGALIALLIDRGVIDEDELGKYMISYLEQELRSHQELFRELSGIDPDTKVSFK